MVSDRSRAPMTVDLSLSEATRSRSLDRLVKREQPQRTGRTKENTRS